MILGLGLDLLDTERMRTELDTSGDHFKQRIFTAGEIAYCDAKARPFEHYAGRFAAKEAFLKALGSGLRDGIQWLDISVVSDQYGKPELHLQGIAKLKLEAMGVERVMVSLSHIPQCAAAVVILERGEPCREK